MDLIKRSTKEDPRICYMAKVIHLQSLIFVLIIFIIAVFVAIKAGYIQLPSKEALDEPVPFDEKQIQYQIYAYQDGKYVKHESTLPKDHVQLVGQVYDFKTVQSKWPDFEFFINSQNVPIPRDSGAFSLDFFLNPGKNTFNTYVRANGVDLNKQQLILYYQTTSTRP